MATDIANLLKQCIAKGETVLNVIKKESFAPNLEKKLDKVFNRTQAAKMIGVSSNGLKKAEDEGRLPLPGKDSATDRPIYNLLEINRARDYFKTRPQRKVGDEPLTLGIINFKGGVYKSTINLHLAQYLALEGYRVLSIDADSQASSTRFFVFNPDSSEQEVLTIGDFLTGHIHSLEPAVRKTYWDGLDIIPANLNLYNAELHLPYRAGQGQMSSDFYTLLRDGIETVKDNYDVVLIDAPPALGIVSMNVVYASDALLIPVPPSYSDFSSTLQFFNMLDEVVEAIGTRRYKFIKLLLTKYDMSEETQAFASVIKHVFGQETLLKSAFSNTKEIPRASQNLRTVLEQTDVKVKKTYDRAIKIINNFCSEIETHIISTWPSYAKEMMEEGVIV